MTKNAKHRYGRGDSMRRARRVFAFVALCATVVRAVTIEPGWCIAYPESGSKDVNRALLAAAEEVRRDIAEATGVKLKTVPASKAKAPAIWIGAEFAENAGLNLVDLKWYDNVIAEKGGSIYLFGNDRPGRTSSESQKLSWTDCVLPSVRAVARFLETAVGVRFLMPGKIGTEIPKRKEISLADGCVLKETPMLIYGGGGLGDSIMFRMANGLWGPGTFHTYGGHTYPKACPADKYFKTHPEYIGLKNGKRTLGSNNGHTALCISNPEVEELIVAELERKFDAGAEVCQLGQHDGWSVCECDKCRALYGTGDDWGEKFWCFHRHIAERILKDRPGKIVQIMNYARTGHPPKTFKIFPANVMIEKCSYSEAAFREWDGYTVPKGFTVYTYLSGAYVRPGFVARHSFAHLAQLVKRFRDNNVRGIYRCGGLDLFGTEGPGYYIYNRLLLDGSQNVSALLSDYCLAAFGPAAATMRKFYDAQDARLRMFDKVVEGFPADSAAGLDRYLSAVPQRPLDLHGWMFSPDTTAFLEECLSRAETTEGLSSKQRKRLALVRLEFDYAKNLGAISTLYSVYRLHPSKETLVPVLDEVEKRNEWMDRLFGDRDRPKRLDGWPELRLFGHECTRRNMVVNGRLSAQIGAPLTWPVADIKRAGILPGLVGKTASAVRTVTAPTFAEFETGEGWHELGGISMERVPLKARFRALYDAANLYVLSESELSDEVAVKSFPRDGNVWVDECVDMVIASGDSRDLYYHFIYGVDPESRYDEATGLITDPLDPGYGKADVTWNGKGWKVESRRGGGKWRSIATFPYSDFGVAAPNPGDHWFINVGRIAKPGESRKGGEILMLWSPNVESRTIVAPHAMGRLNFK